MDKTILPILKSLLKPAVIEEMKQQRGAHQEWQKFYNRRARDLPALAAGDQVWIQPAKVGDREWKKATVLKEVVNRSYKVKTENDQTLIRNRRHLKEAKSRSASGDDHQQIQELPKIPEFAKWVWWRNRSYSRARPYSRSRCSKHNLVPRLFPI